MLVMIEYLHQLAVGINAESDFQFDGTNVFIPNEIRHIGDPDTKLGFTTDTITLTAVHCVETLTTSVLV